MQDYCVGTIGASCALVVVFPAATKSGNPGNCGNACSCDASVRIQDFSLSCNALQGVVYGVDGRLC